MGLARRILAVVLILTAGEAVEAAYRGVYINGQVHLFCNGCNNYSVIQHKAGAPDSNKEWQQSGATQQIDSPVPPVYTSQWGEGTAVLNNRIYYFPLGCPGNQDPSKGRYVYCVPFDLPSNAFDTSKMVQLGKVNNVIDGVGSAAVTFSPPEQSQSTIYVFTDENIYTSGDGVNWSSHGAPLVPASSMLEPLDAIVFYPPDSNPLIMVAYMQMGNPYIGQGLWAAIWNGKFGSASQMTLTRISDSGQMYQGALFLGTADAASPYHAGAKQTCVQLFTSWANGGPSQRWEYAYDASGGRWTQDPGEWNNYDPTRAFAWYEGECSTSQNNQAERQHLVLNAESSRRPGAASSSWKALDVKSDVLVPINTTDLGVNCNAWGGATNATNVSDSDTSEDATTFRKYWTLVGVILGSPPFALNGWTGFELEDFSNVTYGSQASGEVSHSEERENQLMFSAGLTVMGGVAHLFEVEDEMDLGYKYGWETSHETTSTATMGFDQTFGTTLANTEDPTEMGKYGWAIFNVPNVVIQDYAVYAYDYDVNNTASGTYLNQDLHSTQILNDDISVVYKAFELAHPGGPDDSVLGLMAGMGTFSGSTDLGWWSAVPWTWESKTSPWSVVLGEKTDPTVPETLINTLSYANSTGGSVYFSQEQENVQTSGYTSDIDISNKTQISVGTKLKGFKVSLAAGYDSHFASSVTNSTAWEKSVTADLGMKPCSEADCVKSMTIQPYFLKAASTSNSQLAPWIPTNYNSQRPWCMTWAVKSYSTYGGTQAGASEPPGSGSGKVVGGNGGTSDPGGPKWSSYSIQGGHMAWPGSDGGTTPIPLTADSFDPGAGASVQMNGYTVSAMTSRGKWTRNGQVWKFKTKESAKRDVVVLKLDFGTQTWDLDLSKADLSPYISPSLCDLRADLTVNDKYAFHCAFAPQVKTTWDLKVPSSSPGQVELTRYSGNYDSAKGEGTVTLKGDLPKHTTDFGDMSFSVNGHQVNASLISLKDYDDAVAKGKELVYNNGGLHLAVDFGKGTWKADFKKSGFHPLFAPRWGRSRISVSVGGTTVYSQEHAITDHTTTLSFTS